MSAVTVLFILKEFMENLSAIRERELGLLAALGPGFSAELLLLEWGRE
jgi:alkylresorcinol/alkylpyrone synthase